MSGPAFAKMVGVLAMLCTLSGSAQGQEWARKLFSEFNHDFGTVARGSDTEYRFEIVNCFEEDVHIQSVRSSCGCTAPSVENNLLRTWEKGYIVAKFNTRGSFTGHHSATLTVTIDKPFPAQVQLRVHGNIRGDVVFNPGAINFEDVDQGTTQKQRVGVRYAGVGGWKIQDVVTSTESSSHYEVELVETNRVGGVVEYDLLVQLNESAPAGYLQDQLVLVTSDRNNPRIPLKIEGRVIPEISVAPEHWVIGEVGYGQKVGKNLIVRGKNDFQIAKVECDDSRFQFDFDTQKTGKTHVIKADFAPATGGSGQLKKEIRVITSLGETYTASCIAYARIIAPAETHPEEAGDRSSATASVEGATAGR